MDQHRVLLSTDTEKSKKVNQGLPLQAKIISLFLISLISIGYAISAILSNSLCLLYITFLSFSKLIGMYISSISCTPTNLVCNSIQRIGIIVAVSINYSLKIWIFFISYNRFFTKNIIQGEVMIFSGCLSLLISIGIGMKIGKVYQVQHKYTVIEVFICVAIIFIGLAIGYNQEWSSADYFGSFCFGIISLIHGGKLLNENINYFLNSELSYHYENIQNILYSVIIYVD